MDLRTKAPFCGVPGPRHLSGDVGRFCWFFLTDMSGRNCHQQIPWETTTCFGARVLRPGHAK